VGGGPGVGIVGVRWGGLGWGGGGGGGAAALVGGGEGEQDETDQQYALLFRISKHTRQF
jgi:hypothetical protein